MHHERSSPVCFPLNLERSTRPRLHLLPISLVEILHTLIQPSDTNLACVGYREVTVQQRLEDEVFVILIGDVNIRGELVRGKGDDVAQSVLVLE